MTTRASHRSCLRAPTGTCSTPSCRLLARQADGLTWAATAEALACRPSQLTGLRTARFATSAELALRITQWLGRPAADVVYAAEW